jgi:nucleoside-diphosphate-sugar epimerase
VLRSRRIAGSRILITGSTGFLGAHLSRALTGAGADVRAYSGDITDRSSLCAGLAASRPDFVFHLAAYGTTPIQKDGERMRAVNVGGIENLWVALDGTDARLIQTGTCAEYATKNGPISEHDPCAPESDYAATLHEAVSYSQACAHRTGREVIILRPFGPYGPGDRAERVIPFVIRGLLGTGRISVTAGQQRRDFSYVADHVAAFVAAATAQLAQTGSVYNIGSGCPISVRDVVVKIARMIGGDAAGRVDFGAAAARPDDRADRYADITAARRDLAFAPAVALDEGLRLTIEAMR